MAAPFALMVALSFTFRACAQQALPVLPLVVSETGWTPQPLPVGNYFGDIRAVVMVPPNQSSFTAQIFWRRRDPTPSAKIVLVVAAATNLTVPVAPNATIEPTCGVVTFTPASEGGLYYVYYLPYTEVSPPDFWEITFSWQGCNDTSDLESNPCVMGRRALAAGGSAVASLCTAASPAADAVLRLESRDTFNGFTDMEMMAAPAETAAAAAALAAAGAPFGVFCESADRPIRVFVPPRADGSGGGIPVRWATAPSRTSPSFSSSPAAPGSLLVFQAGLWAYTGGALANVSASATLPELPSADFTFFNLGGVDPSGSAFNTTWGLRAGGGVGALWIGVALPGSAAPGPYAGWLDITANTNDTVRVALNISVADVPPVPDEGAGNITSMARLGWLNSRRGIDDTVPAPFVSVGSSTDGDTLTVTALLKNVTLSQGGLPASVAVQAPKVRGGVPVVRTRQLLAAPIAFDVFDDSLAPMPQTVTSPAAVSALFNSSVSWTANATAAAGALHIDVAGSLDFASYCSFAVTLTATLGPVRLGDVRLTLPVAPAIAQYVMGMGKLGQNYSDLQWRWAAGTPYDKVWLGRPDAGVMLLLKGAGNAWDTPGGGIPFVPNSWGGAAALSSGNPNGLNLTNATAVAFSGARTLSPGDPPLTFLFDLALTPSKPLDMVAHYAHRTVQVGYGTPYLPPETVKAMGATIGEFESPGCASPLATLRLPLLLPSDAAPRHTWPCERKPCQPVHVRPSGTGGRLPDTLTLQPLPPLRNYPFTDDVVPLLTNYTAQSNALGMAAKFYYTVRELSHHAVELMAFKALTDEILVGGDPWDSGSGGGWNQHGGGAWLHQHLITDYQACWQNPLANGEWDQAVCDEGTSRMLNYYIEGLHWSVSHAPFIDGIYYVGASAGHGSGP